MILNISGSIVINVSGSIEISEEPSTPPVFADYITNGTFDTDTNWIKGTGVTISSGQASIQTSAGTLSQDFGALKAPLVQGQDYVFTFGTVNPGFTGVYIYCDDQVIYDGIPLGAAIEAPFTASAAHSTLTIGLYDDNGVGFDNISLAPAL